MNQSYIYLTRKRGMSSHLLDARSVDFHVYMHLNRTCQKFDSELMLFVQYPCPWSVLQEWNGTVRNRTEPVFGHVPLRWREEKSSKTKLLVYKRREGKGERGGNGASFRTARPEKVVWLYIYWPTLPLFRPPPPPPRHPVLPLPAGWQPPAGAPPAHKLSRYTRARCTRHRTVTHKMTPDVPLLHRSPLLLFVHPPSLTPSRVILCDFYSKIMSRRLREIPATRINERTKANLMKMFYACPSRVTLIYFVRPADLARDCSTVIS